MNMEISKSESYLSKVTNLKKELSNVMKLIEMKSKISESQGTIKIHEMYNGISYEDLKLRYVYLRYLELYINKYSILFDSMNVDISFDITMNNILKGEIYLVSDDDKCKITKGTKYFNDITNIENYLQFSDLFIPGYMVNMILSTSNEIERQKCSLFLKLYTDKSHLPNHTK